MPTSSSLISPPLEVRSTERPFNRQIVPPLDLGLPYWFHLFFPDRALTTNLRVLVVGCDDDLAIRLARANPRARITVVEKRADVLAAAGQAAEHQNLANVEPVAEWPAAKGGDDGFDLIYYNQPSWPEESPQSVLAAAAGLLRLEGSLHLTVRARYAWSGVAIVQELFERLGVQPDAEGYPRARQIVAELGPDHPWNLLGPDPRLRSDDLLADWLGSGQPSFTVPELYELLAASGLCLQRFTYQAYYLPQCSPLARTPLLGELRKLAPERQHALMELYWPGMRYHLAIACRTDRPPRSVQIGFGGADWLFYAPLLPAKLPVEEGESVGAQVRLRWRAAGMPELAVSLGGFQHRLLRSLDRAEELAEVVALAGLSGDPQLRDEWARDFFQTMADYDFLHFRICHSPSLTSPAPQPESAEPEEPATAWAQLANLSDARSHAEPSIEDNTPEALLEIPEPPLTQDPGLTTPPAWTTESEPGVMEPLQEEQLEPEPLPIGEVPADASRNELDPASATSPAAPPLDQSTQPDRSPETEKEAVEPSTPSPPSVEETPAPPDRIPYEACPLCSGPDHESLREANAELAVGGQPLRATIPWVRCRACGHVFTSGYFAGDSWMPILQEALRWRRGLRGAIKQRAEASRIVAAITALRESASGRWLDVGCSNAGLVTVASEFGYKTAGVDCCRDAAQLLAELGYAVTAGSLFDRHDGPFDVVSLSGVVDGMPFPCQALSHVHQLLAPHGLVYLSALTTDSLRWRKLDAEEANPYWGRLDRYHAFHRKSLFELLRKVGFEPCSYGASGTSGLGMEVIACKA